MYNTIITYQAWPPFNGSPNKNKTPVTQQLGSRRRTFIRTAGALCPIHRARASRSFTTQPSSSTGIDAAASTAGGRRLPVSGSRHPVTGVIDWRSMESDRSDEHERKLKQNQKQFLRTLEPFFRVFVSQLSS